MVSHLDTLKEMRSENHHYQTPQTQPIYYAEPKAQGSNATQAVVSTIAFFCLLAFMMFQHFEIANLKTELARLSHDPDTQGIYHRIQSNEADLKEIQTQILTIQYDVTENKEKTNKIIEVFQKAEEAQRTNKTQDLESFMNLIIKLAPMLL